MAKLESAAVLAVLAAAAFLYLKYGKMLDSAGSALTTVSNIEKSVEKYVTQTITQDYSQKIIEQNKNAGDTTGYVQETARRDPFGHSLLENWQTNRNKQVGLPTETYSVAGYLNRGSSLTVPSNREIGANLAAQTDRYWFSLKDAIKRGERPVSEKSVAAAISKSSDRGTYPSPVIADRSRKFRVLPS